MKLGKLMLVLALMLSFSWSAYAQEEGTPQPAPQVAPEKPAKSPLAIELERFYEGIWKLIGDQYYSPEALARWGEWQHKYDGKLESGEDLDSALTAMTESLGDRWTRYFSHDQITEQMGNRLAGIVHIGFNLDKQPDGSFRVIAVQWGSPAHKSVLRVGDTVKSINGKALAGLTAKEADALLVAATGTQMKVVYVDNGKDAEAELAFAATAPAQVDVKLLPGDVIYARLPTFESVATVQQFKKELIDTITKAGGKVEGVVFDLRGNTGGRFDMAPLVASLFLETGTLVTSTTRTGQIVVEQTHKVIPTPVHERAALDAETQKALALLKTVPLVVLADGSTMSASEIVIGALKDNKRARIVGTATFGKAVGWSRFTLRNGGALMVTTLKYLTPAGHDVSKSGIQPHKRVAQPRSSEDAQLDAGLAELKKLVKK